MYVNNPLPVIPSKEAVKYRLCFRETTSLAIEHEIRDEEREEEEEQRLGFLLERKERSLLHSILLTRLTKDSYIHRSRPDLFL